MVKYEYEGSGQDLFDTSIDDGLNTRLLQTRASLPGAGLAGLRTDGHFTGGSGGDSLTGGAGDDTISGLDGDDVLSGLAGNDSLFGGAGIDTLSGGAGADILNGGADNDWANYAASASGVSVSLLTGIGSGGDAAGDTLFSIEALNGSAKADVLIGNNGHNALYGNAGNDVIDGGGGDDVLRGGTGADQLTGGTGLDWANYRDSTTGVTIDLTAGTGARGYAAGDRLYSIENLSGSAKADILIGNDAANVLNGNEGNDVIDGGTGNDVLRGGTGADQLTGGAGLDWASYLDSSTGVSIDLTAGTGAWGEAAGDTLDSIENLIGSQFYDLLNGDAGNNAIYGYGGDDTIHGKGGSDRADGGGGNDFITGGDGIDILVGGDGDDLIDGGIGRDVIAGGAGNDVIYGGPDPDVVVYDFAWEDISADYDGTDFSIWVVAPDGTDHVFTALTIATTTGTYRFDVPTATWVYESTMTSSDWLDL